MAIKVLYNRCYGEFSLSPAAVAAIRELGIKCEDGGRGVSRHDPRIVAVVESLGKGANGGDADIRVATIEGNKYRIDEYDGAEAVMEPEDYAWIKV